MNQTLQGLKNDDLRRMATQLAKQLPPPQPAGGPLDKARMEQARRLIGQHRCNFCHQGNYSGEQNVPRYKNNTRRGCDASMADVLYPISDEQILDFAYFLARVR